MRFEGFEDRDIGWAEPCHRDLAALMLSCYEEREAVILAGERGRRWLVENGTWGHAAERLVLALQEVGVC